MNESFVLRGGQIASFEEERQSLREAFLETHGYKSSSFFPLPMDASRRCYFRGPKVLLMDAPPPEEDTKQFQKIAGLLREAGLTVPEVYHSDPQNGFLLIEDLGELPYRRAFEKGFSETLLYRETVKALAHLHHSMPQNSIGVDPYDLSLFLKNVSLFLEWNESSFTPVAEEEFLKAWEEAFKTQSDIPHSLCLKDVMVDNLLWLPDREGLQRCGFIDFQDALWGPISYDLVSLLEDARRDIPPQFAQQIMDVYFDTFPNLSQDDFFASYFLWGAQRSTRILGVFLRLSKREGKSHYLNHLPRVRAYLQRDLEHPHLKALKSWFSQYARLK